MKTNELPTHEEIEAMSPDEKDALIADVRAGLYMPRRDNLCPISGMGRDIAEWNECDIRCTWYERDYGCVVFHLCEIR